MTMDAVRDLLVEHVETGILNSRNSFSDSAEETDVFARIFAATSTPQGDSGQAESGRIGVRYLSCVVNNMQFCAKQWHCIVEDMREEFSSSELIAIGQNKLDQIIALHARIAKEASDAIPSEMVRICTVNLERGWAFH